MDDSRPIRLYWFRGKPNFGDALSPLLVAHLSGRQVVHAKRGKEALRAIGSILDDIFKTPSTSAKRLFYKAYAPFRKPLAVWGSGFLRPHDPTATDIALRPIALAAVRGTLTRDFLRHLLGERACDWKALPLGDPGLLAGCLCPTREEKRYDLGLMSHYIDSPVGDFLSERLRLRYGRSLCVIDPSAEPLGVLTRIAQCRTLLTSAMHGAIVADALGVPNRVCRLSFLGQDTAEGYAFKFRDYYSFCGAPFAPWSLGDVLDAPNLPERIEQAYAIPAEAVAKAQTELERAFPL